MAVTNLKPKGKGLEGRFVGMELVGDFVAGRSKADRLFTVRLDYDPSLGGDFARGRAELFRFRKGAWENTTMIREEGEDVPTLFPRYRPVPAWLSKELDIIRMAWEKANPVAAKARR